MLVIQCVFEILSMNMHLYNASTLIVIYSRCYKVKKWICLAVFMNFRLTIQAENQIIKLRSSFVCGFRGVMVSTLDFESSDPSSNLGGT